MTHLITNHELTRLSLAELQGLYRIIFNELAQSQPGTPERRNALASLERILREIRRRTRVVGCFPDGQSALMLAAARLRHIAGTKWGVRRYISMEPLREMEQNQAA